MPDDLSSQSTRRAVASSLDDRRPRAYRREDIRALLAEEREAWNLPASATAPKLIEALLRDGRLRQVELRPEVAGYRSIRRYLWAGCTPLEVASTLREAGYLSHGTAVYLHGLTELIPRTFYVNYEQTPKPAPAGAITQEAVDRAFRARQRLSRYTFQAEGNRYTILSGKHTGDFGVEPVIGPSGEPLRVAGLERTLVDIVVRPAYAGGLYQVLEAYRAAREQGASVPGILAALEALDYRYPYHQSIGFLMERAGFEAEDLESLRELGTRLDFYLGYAMDSPQLDPSWRVFHPEGF